MAAAKKKANRKTTEKRKPAKKRPGTGRIRSDRKPVAPRPTKGQVPKKKKRAKKEPPPKTEDNPNGLGRYRIVIDWEEFDQLCIMQCTLEEIAAFFGCSADTIERRVKEETGVTFADYFAQKRTEGFVSLRRAQFNLAEETNPFMIKAACTMLIFLGKQYLGQSDKIDATVGTRVDYREMKKAMEKGKTTKQKVTDLLDFLQKTGK